jgi:hypothetical protein
MRFFVFISYVVLMCALTSTAHAAKWQIDRVNHLTLAPPAGVTVNSMSGVTYLGPVNGNHRFVAAEQTKGELVQFDLALNASGAITGISDITAIDLAAGLNWDFEGIAYTSATRNSVFLADETNPGVREVSLATGAQLQNLSLPAVFTNDRGNKSLESLTRNPNGTAMWTANEESLNPDGPSSEGGGATSVRLLKMNVVGDVVSNGPQFAYQVEPIHGGPTILGAQSGLTDLIAMPDGTLLALERSVAAASPNFLNRVFEIDSISATDVSGLAGLVGQLYTPVAKQLVWSGAADGGAVGQNLEGLSLGPRLVSGSWVLIGVVDDGDPFSNNTIVAFTASAIPSADFDDDGDVDGADFLSWQQGVGASIGATHVHGDADRDGDVDGADLNLWKSGYSATSAGKAASAAIPEPAIAAMILPLAGLALTSAACGSRHRRHCAASEGAVAQRQSG